MKWMTGVRRAERNEVWEDEMAELTSKQRAQLRAMANPLEPIVHIGKGDLGDNQIGRASCRERV